MSTDFKILNGTVKPLVGHFSDSQHFVLNEIPANNDITKAVYKLPIINFSRKNSIANTLPTAPNTFSSDMLDLYFGDSLHLFCNIYRNGSTDYPAFVGFFGHDAQDYINTRLYSYDNNQFNLTDYTTTPINMLLTNNSSDYYIETGVYPNINDNSFLEFLFVYDENTEHVFFIQYWAGGVPCQIYDKATVQRIAFVNINCYYSEKMIEYIANNGELYTQGYQIDVTNYVEYKKYSDYDDGNGSNPGQGQNDDNVGGDGSHDNSSDDLDDNDYNKGDNDSSFGPQLNDPNWNSGATLYTLFKMTFTQVGNLITYLTGSTWQSTVTQLGLGSIFGAINKCLTVPFDVNSSFNGYSIHILGINTNVATSGVVNHTQSVDCGNITIDRYFGDFKDYNPYTRVFVYLPYIGVNELNCNQIMGKSLNLTYGVDLLDGSCVARLTADGIQLASYSGNCATEYPIVGKSGLNPLQAVSNLVGLNYGENLGALTGLTESLLTKGGSSASTFQTVGGVAGNWGNVGVLTPFVYIERPVQSMPNSYDSSFGWTCNKYLPLNVLSGYTEVDESLHLSTTATDEEKEMLKEILTNGFYINDNE